MADLAHVRKGIAIHDDEGRLVYYGQPLTVAALAALRLQADETGESLWLLIGRTLARWRPRLTGPGGEA